MENDANKQSPEQNENQVCKDQKCSYILKSTHLSEFKDCSDLSHKYLKYILYIFSKYIGANLPLILLY